MGRRKGLAWVWDVGSNGGGFLQRCMHHGSNTGRDPTRVGTISAQSPLLCADLVSAGCRGGPREGVFAPSPRTQVALKRCEGPHALDDVRS